MKIELTEQEVNTLDKFLDNIKEAREIIYSRYLEMLPRQNMAVDNLIFRTLRDLTYIKDAEGVIGSIEEQFDAQKQYGE